MQTSQPQKTKNQEIKVQEPGNLGRNLEVYQQHQKELRSVVHQNKEWNQNDSDSLCPMNIHRFPPFRQRGWNISRCDKLVNDNLIWHCLLNMVVRFVSCQPIDQIWQKCLRTVKFYKIGARKSVLYKAKMKIFKESVYHQLVNLFTVSFFASSWDCEIPLKIVCLTVKP